MQLRLGRRPPSEYELAREQRRAGPPTVVSVVLHILLVLVVASAITSSTTLQQFFFSDQTPPTPHEQIQFVAVAPDAAGSSTAPTSPTRAAPAPRVEEPAPVLVAPREIPTGVPTPTPPSNPGASNTNPGPLAGGSGSARGAQPAYVDPRLWVPDPALIYAPKTDMERLDSALVTSFKRYQDSVAANAYAPNKFERGDWTVERDGKKYGIDSKFIHLGKFSIPTALLAMLPLNMGQANPTDVDRARAASFMRNDILYHAQAAVNEDEFRKAVKAIRDRKDREHRQEQEKIIARKGDPHTIVAPGDRPPQ